MIHLLEESDRINDTTFKAPHRQPIRDPHKRIARVQRWSSLRYRIIKEITFILTQPTE